ncbi:MAG: xanthomonadin transporter [Proteobacteria bacterium]|nr:xanthomonadin transporter [Pseudomonadota bacterium]
MSAHGRWFGIAAWWLALALAAFAAQRTLVVSNDLRSFMPPPRDAEQKVLMDQIGDGPASRLLLLAIAGAPPPTLAALSRGLVDALRADPRFAQALNGSESLARLDPKLLPYRYLLSPTLDGASLDTAFLHAQLEERLQDLGSPAASALDDILPRDPTLEALALAQRWAPRHAPALREGVWFSARGEALLVAATRAPGLDTAAQAQAIAAARAAFAALPGAAGARLEISGPGYIGAQIAAATRAEAERLSAIGTAGFVLVLLLAYRSAAILALVVLPLASGALAGLAAIALGFGNAHGITLAFGFTLLGVAQEYPLRVLSHRRAGTAAKATVRAVWPLLRLAIVSACIAYLAFLASGVAGLQQLAVFTIVALLVAGAATRWLLPPLLPDRFRDVAESSAMQRAQRWLAALPRPRALPWIALALGIAALRFAPAPLWQNDLAALAPAPPRALAREGELRAALGAPDVRYLLVLQADSADGVLRLGERITPQVDQWISTHVVDDVELPSRWLPSVEIQRARQAKLPDRATLTATLDAALRDLPFQPGLFAPFVDDVETARALPPLTPQMFERSPFGARLAATLIERDGRWVGLATLDGVHDPAALAGIAAQTDGAVRLLDLKSASEELIAQYRERILKALGVAFALLVLAVAIAFRDLRRAWHVLAPMSLATLLAIAVLRICGVPLSLFHLVAVTLAAGLGLHYALFFERPVADAAEARRTLHATLVCVAAALGVFGLLATSSIPVLRAIGATVALGVAFHFILSTQMAMRRAG